MLKLLQKWLWFYIGRFWMVFIYFWFCLAIISTYYLQLSSHKKCAFPLRIKFLAQFVTFTEEIFNRKLHLCSVLKYFYSFFETTTSFLILKYLRSSESYKTYMVLTFNRLSCSYAEFPIIWDGEISLIYWYCVRKAVYSVF